MSILSLSSLHSRRRGGRSRRRHRRLLCRRARRRCLFGFLDQTADGVGRLRAFTNPIFGAIEFQRAVVPRLLRIVRADDLDEFAVARAAAVSHYHFVIRAIFAPSLRNLIVTAIINKVTRVKRVTKLKTLYQVTNFNDVTVVTLLTSSSSCPRSSSSFASDRSAGAIRLPL